MKANELKITDILVADIDGLPKHMILVKVYTNDPDIVGYGEVRDASSATYAKMLKSRLVGENPLNVEKLFNRIKQFGGHSRQGGGVSGIEIALFDIVGKFYKVPVYQLLGGNTAIRYAFIAIRTWTVSIRVEIWAKHLKSVWKTVLHILKWIWVSNSYMTNLARSMRLLVCLKKCKNIQ